MVNGVGFWIFFYYCFIVYMGGLVGGGIKVVVGVFWVVEDIFWFYCFGDWCYFIEYKLCYFDVVFLLVEGYV